MKKSQHTIDFLFPLAVFFAFSATAVVVLLLSANIYKGIVSSSEAQFETTTALSYVTEKIRQNDTNGADSIYLSEFNGRHALTIRQKFQNSAYITYIYEIDGELKETFVQEGIAASAKSGTTVMKVTDFKMEQISDNLLQFSCKDNSGYSSSVVVSIHSHSN